MGFTERYLPRFGIESMRVTSLNLQLPHITPSMDSHLLANNRFIEEIPQSSWSSVPTQASEPDKTTDSEENSSQHQPLFKGQDHGKTA
ncbi:conserved hypothetical protein [Ricinus communis]|uniref:Uncharacterized protein n=1 Tax=Ricinus communis TaxID=3988 RepID=B9SLK7_RICCO|nr:conserved hypothetical protein [Ricinus communis]